MNLNIAALNKLGQSIWIDDLSQQLLKSGRLASLISEGISGLTSNPTIFKNAIAGSADYDQVIEAGRLAGQGPEETLEDLMVGDVTAAADLFRPLYDSSGAGDGYVSLEVSPTLAHDSQGTVQAALRLWSKVSRPNLMIKVPATAAGLPAIRELLSAGLNVNVTLIFSVEVYRSVIEAYLAALEQRLAKGLRIDRIRSVASFFVSRFDTICERELTGLVKAGKLPLAEAERFTGTAALENCAAAYNLQLQYLASERFKALSREGAGIQRPLWASTSTKNPRLSPLLYLEELVGQNTVNTLPPKTIEILLQGAKVSTKLPRHEREGAGVLRGLQDLGLDLPALLRELEVQGVQVFADSYSELLAAVQKKMQRQEL